MIEEITPLLERLHQGTIDMAMFVLPFPVSELLHLKLFDEQLYAVLTAKHPLAGNKEIRLSDLNQEPFWLPKEGHCIRDSVIAACRQSKVMPTIVFESGQFSPTLAMVSAGMGISAGPAMAVHHSSAAASFRSQGKTTPGRSHLIASPSRNLRPAGPRAAYTGDVQG